MLEQDAIQDQDAPKEQDATQEQPSSRQEYCLAMLRWGMQALRTVKCESVEEYQYRINVVGYLGNCYIAEGGTLAELQALDTALQELDTAQWFTTEPNAGFPL